MGQPLSFYLNRSYLILYSPLCSLSQQFLDLGRYCLAVGTSCQALAGNTHNLAHFLSTGGANLGNNSAEFCFQFLGSEPWEGMLTLSCILALPRTGPRVPGTFASVLGTSSLGPREERNHLPDRQVRQQAGIKAGKLHQYEWF